MNSRTYKSEPIKENPHKVDIRQLYSDASAQVMHITLKPGEAVKPHITPVDVVFYVLEGTPTVHVGEESQIFDKDTLIESPADIVHYLSNESGEQVRILVIKSPRPVTPTKIV